MTTKMLPSLKQFGGTAKTLGFTFGGFAAGNAISQMAKKDNWKFNGALAVIAVLLGSIAKKDWVQNIALGGGLYFGTKTLNNLASPTVIAGLSGVPDNVKNIINKYIPRLGDVEGTEDYSGMLDEEERQILNGYISGGDEELLGRIRNQRALPSAGYRAPAPTPSRVLLGAL